MLTKRLVSLCVALTVLFVAGALSLALAEARFTNLKILPKSTSKDQLKKVMKAQSEALGVDCDFCHDENDMASDNNEHKKIARSMMKMTKEINSKWFGKDKGAEFVSCATCHRGKAEPPDFVPPPKKDDDAKPAPKDAPLKP